MALKTIGNSSDYGFKISDESTPTNNYVWYIKPEKMICVSWFKPTTKKEIVGGKSVNISLGVFYLAARLKNIYISPVGAFSANEEYEKLLQAYSYWTQTSNGLNLYCTGNDVNSKNFFKAASKYTPETLTTQRGQIVDPLEFELQPNGDYLIRELVITRVNSITGMT